MKLAVARSTTHATVVLGPTGKLFTDSSGDGDLSAFGILLGTQDMRIQEDDGTLRGV